MAFHLQDGGLNGYFLLDGERIIAEGIIPADAEVLRSILTDHHQNAACRDFLIRLAQTSMNYAIPVQTFLAGLGIKWEKDDGPKKSSPAL